MKLRDLRDAIGLTSLGIAIALCALLLMVWDEPMAQDEGYFLNGTATFRYHPMPFAAIPCPSHEPGESMSGVGLTNDMAFCIREDQIEVTVDDDTGAFTVMCPVIVAQALAPHTCATDYDEEDTDRRRPTLRMSGTAPDIPDEGMPIVELAEAPIVEDCEPPPFAGEECLSAMDAHMYTDCLAAAADIMPGLFPTTPERHPTTITNVLRSARCNGAWSWREVR